MSPNYYWNAKREDDMGMSFDWIGQAVGTVADYFGGQEDQDFSNQTREHQENFQREMSNTQWQRGVKDMKAAGLNPMLAYSQGGASSPSGSTGGGPSGGHHYGASAAQAVSSAGQAAVNRAQVENLRAQTGKTEAERDAVIASTPGFAVTQRRDMASAKQIEQLVDYLTKVQGFREEGEKSEYRQTRMREGEEEARVPFQKRRAAQEPELTAAHIRKILAESVLSELDEPGARARAKSDETYYGQNIRPYMDEAGKVVGSAAGALLGSRALGALRRIRPFEKGAGPRKRDYGRAIDGSRGRPISDEDYFKEFGR